MCGVIREKVLNSLFALFILLASFRGMKKESEIVLVGSIKESSKIGELDEADCLLLLKRKYNEYLFFNEESQEIQFVDTVLPESTDEELRDLKDLEPFRTEENTFDSKAYFMTFLSTIFSVLSVQGEELPSRLGLSMAPLKTSYVPCKRCMTMDNQGAHTKRCFHDIGCDHRENCGCTNYTSPCISYTKVGKPHEI